MYTDRGKKIWRGEKLERPKIRVQARPIKSTQGRIKSTMQQTVQGLKQVKGHVKWRCCGGGIYIYIKSAVEGRNTVVGINSVLPILAYISFL